MGKSFKWASLDDAAPLDVDHTFHGPLGVVIGTAYDGNESEELARDFADFVKNDTVCAFFAPSEEAEKVDAKGKKDPKGYNFLGSTLKRIVEEGILEPVLMGTWKRREDGGSFPSPWLAFFPPKKTAKSSKKVAAKKKSKFKRKS